MTEKLQGFVREAFCMNAMRLLKALPTASIDAVLTDPMYMVAPKKSKSCIYDWGRNQAEEGQTSIGRITRRSTTNAAVC
jgi:hypothetical protein